MPAGVCLQTGDIGFFFFNNEGTLYISASGYVMLIWEDYFSFYLSRHLSISQLRPAFPSVNTEKGKVQSLPGCFLSSSAVSSH